MSRMNAPETLGRVVSATPVAAPSLKVVRALASHTSEPSVVQQRIPVVAHQIAEGDFADELAGHFERRPGLAAEAIGAAIVAARVDQKVVGAPFGTGLDERLDAGRRL